MKTIKNSAMKSGILLIFLLLSSCALGSGEEQNSKMQDFEADDIEKVENKDYSSKEIDLDSIKIKKASGLLYEKKLIYISDSDAKVVNVYSKDFSLIDKISDEKLTTPSLITSNKDSIFVLDKLSYKIFEFKKNQNNSYIRENIFSLPTMDIGTEVLDLDSFENKLYLTFFTGFSKDAIIISIDIKSKEILKVKGDYGEFFGYIGSSLNGDLHFISTLEYYKDTGKSGFKKGKSKMFDLELDEIKIKKSLPSGIILTDFLALNDNYYIYNSGFSSVDRFDSELKYIDSLSTFDISDMTVVLKGNSERLLLLMLREQKLWEIKKKWNR